MTIVIKKITPVSEGEELALEIVISDGKHYENISGSVASRMFLELGYPLSVGDGIEIDREKLTELEHLMRLTSAIKKGIELLAFSQNTKKGLIRKLTARGFEREPAQEAAQFLCEVGYIDEDGQACALARELAEKKLYGIVRIKNELYKKGFCEDAIRSALEIDVDFDALCAERIKTTFGAEVFDDRESRAKAIAALLRYGFTVDNIRSARSFL